MSCTKRFSGWFLPVAVLAAAVLLVPNMVFAAVVFTGDVTPTDSDEWQWMDGIVGNTSTGAVTIDSGSELYSPRKPPALPGDWQHLIAP